MLIERNVYAIVDAQDRFKNNRIEKYVRCARRHAENEKQADRAAMLE